MAGILDTIQDPNRKNEMCLVILMFKLFLKCKKTVVLCFSWLPIFCIISCQNDPFPRKNNAIKIRHIPFVTAPKTLDPAVAYTSGISNEIVMAVYEPLLSYHYLKRPYELTPGIAKAVPIALTLPDGKIKYTFHMHQGLMFHNDPCFIEYGHDKPYRQADIHDIVYQFHRLADRQVLSPVINNFSAIDGFAAFSEALDEKRKASQEFNLLPFHHQYASVGLIKGFNTPNDLTLEITLQKPFPQLLYWLATPFISPVPWEAVEYYDGKNGRNHFRNHPVGTGPYDLVHYDKEYKIVLDKNDRWWGTSTPSPYTRYPAQGEPNDKIKGFLSDEYINQPLGFIHRYEYRRDKESTSQFGKFIQGYYDTSGISKERFDAIIDELGLSPDMIKLGITLQKSVDPHIRYLGFNMSDSIVGHDGKERARLLRQAMSLAIDSNNYREIFTNGRGVAAESPIPPGLFGYEKKYKNSYRTVDLEKARALLAQAGYLNGIDASTGKPLTLSFDVVGTTSSEQMSYEYYVSSWKKIGLNVEINGSNSNQFREKIRKNAYQIFLWGWIADYPDPENFLFLLYSKLSRKKHNGPNTANYNNPEYDDLFLSMKNMANNSERKIIIQKMKRKLEEDCPWIPLLHGEAFSLSHIWVKNNKPFGMMFSKLKYLDVDTIQKDKYIKKHNKAIVWPAYLIFAVLIIIFTPGIRAYMKERQ